MTFSDTLQAQLKDAMAQAQHENLFIYLILQRSSAVRRDSLCPSGASLVSTIRRPFGCCPEIRVAETVTLSRIRSI
jgi:hypothetical protein